MSIYHKHHIIPRHMGGTDDADNIVEVTVEQHALLHKQLWKDLGHKEDYVAWQCLSGMLTMSEAKRLALSLGPKKSGEKCKRDKIGYMGLTREQNVMFGKKVVELKKGIHSDSWDKAIGGKIGGQKCKDEGIGFLSPDFDVGKASRGKIWINKNDIEMKIFPQELCELKQDGWEKGRKASFRRKK
jgi:hypothetical protein